MLKDISNIWLPEHELDLAFIYGAVYKVLSSFIRRLRKLSVLGTIHYLSRRVLGGGGGFVGYHIVFSPRQQLQYIEKTIQTIKPKGIKLNMGRKPWRQRKQ